MLQFTELVSLKERIPALPALKCEPADCHPRKLTRDRLQATTLGGLLDFYSEIE